MKNGNNIEVPLPGTVDEVSAFFSRDQREGVVYLCQEGCSTPLGDSYLLRRNNHVVLCGKADAVDKHLIRYMSHCGMPVEGKPQPKEQEALIR